MFARRMRHIRPFDASSGSERFEPRVAADQRHPSDADQ
jgi:hypothetical protein